MIIYVVRDENNQEISSYSNEQEARFNADQMELLYAQRFRVEELRSATDPIPQENVDF
jgi:hypothetical protein